MRHLTPGILKIGEVQAPGATRATVLTFDGAGVLLSTNQRAQGANQLRIVVQRDGDGFRCSARNHRPWRCHGVGCLVSEEHAENQLLRISVPSGDHSPGDLALSPVHPQPARRRGFARRARNCNFVRDSPTLGESLGTDHCSAIAQAPSQAACGLAF